MSRNSMTRFACLGATLVFSVVSHAAMATTDSDPDARRSVVRFADLDITHAEGAAALYKRIAHAAREVCGPVLSMDELRSRWPDPVTLKCETQAIARGVGDVNAPALTAYYEMKAQSAR